MLQLALFCVAEGKPYPSDWADMANRDGPTRWLVRGIEPSCSTCYAFRDRLGEHALLELNHQVLSLAQRLRLTTAQAASIDGSLIEAVGLYRSAGYKEVAPFNSEPYAHHWFEKRLTRKT